MILRDLFGDRKRGFYIDVGAFDPYRFSNTNYFYRKGWSGINIEPSPDAIARFQKKRPRDINLNIGISVQAGNLTYYGFQEAALNTFDKERVKFLEETTRYRHQSTKLVPVNTLRAVLDRHCHQKIDFMNIDVEWREMEVLQSNDWEKYRPKYLLVEVLDFDLEALSSNALHIYLKHIGYRFECKTSRTSFYRDRVVAKSKT